MRNEHKSRAGKYDHVKPLPYKRFHPEVRKVLSGVTFGVSYSNEHGWNSAADNQRDYDKGISFTNPRQYKADLQQLGYNWRNFPRTVEYLQGDYIVLRDLYQLVEADLRDQGILGRKREPLTYGGTARVAVAGGSRPNIQQLSHNTPEAQRIRAALVLGNPYVLDTELG